MRVLELKNILSGYGVSFKTPNKDSEIHLNCPTCRDTKFRLSVNPEVISHGIQGWCYCYKNSHAFTLKNLFKFYKINFDLNQEVQISPQTSFEAFHQKMQGLKDTQEVLIPKPKIVLPEAEFFQPIVPATSWLAKKCLAYLQGRSFHEAQIQEYNLMWAMGDLMNRVIIPFTVEGELVYYQARSIHDWSEQKILNSTEAQCGIGKTQLLFNIDNAQLYDEAIICEGWASSMSAGLNSVAINGKNVSDKQVALLKTYWSKYLVMLDPGAETEALELAGRLKTAKSVVRVAFLKDGDPNEIDADELERYKQEAVPIESVADAKLKLIQWRARC